MHTLLFCGALYCNSGLSTRKNTFFKPLTRVKTTKYAQLCLIMLQCDYSCICVVFLFHQPPKKSVNIVSFQQVNLFSPVKTGVTVPFSGSWVNIHSPPSDLRCFTLLVFIFIFLLPFLQGLWDDVISEWAEIRLYELRRGHHWLAVLSKRNNV